MPPLPDNSNFSNVTQFNAPVEIHTAAQKTYLSYQGDYSTMPEDQYPNGNSHQSDSLPVNLSWNYSVPNGKTLTNYSFITGQYSALQDGYEIQTTNKSVTYYNPYLGRNYFKLVANFSDGTKDETNIKYFDVDSTCPRNLAIDGLTNCRDLGGRITEDGGKIRQGLVFRTSGGSGGLTDSGFKEMTQHLRVQTEINVSDSDSYNLNLDYTDVINCYMNYSGGSHHLSRNTESVKKFFLTLADPSMYPVFFHCRIGTDRTGLCAILLSGLLGVSLNEIYQDYLFSNFGSIGSKRYIGEKAGDDNIQNYIADIQKFSGSTFKNKVYNLLLSIGLTKQSLDFIIANLTEGTEAKGNDAGQIMAPGASLTGHNVEVSKDTTRNNPNRYFVLNSTSTSVSYNFSTTKAFEGQVVVYMGNGDSSSTKKIADAISCTLDTTNVQIKDMSYSDARMGNCSGRVNYFPVILGRVAISAGSHTITITGTSNTMNIGGIYIFDAATAPEDSGSQGGGDPGSHSHNYVAQEPVTNKAGKTVTTYLCECGKKYMDIDFFNGYSSLNGNLNDGTKGKLSEGTVVKYDFPAKAGVVNIQFAIKMSSSSHSSQSFNTSLYTIKVNGETVPLTIANGATYDAVGLNTSSTYISFASYTIPNDTNIEVELDHNASSYRLIFGGNVRLLY